VSLTFDDGTTTQELAGGVLRAHGMHGTFYVNTGKTEAKDPYHLNWPQILQLHAEGNDIGGHTSTHINLTDPAIPEPVKRQEVCQDRERLQQKGLDPQIFAYPDGAVDDTAKAIVESCGYRSARSAGGLSPDGPYFAENIPPQTLTTSALYNPPGPMSLDYLQRAVLAVADHGGGWLPIIFHRICARSDPGFDTCMSGESAMDSSVFSAFLDWLEYAAPEGTTTQTVQEVVNTPG
jgi:peptidoglycan/xylan/chitin deacetylase (PgdA/CDA1 family)